MEQSFLSFVVVVVLLVFTVRCPFAKVLPSAAFLLVANGHILPLTLLLATLFGYVTPSCVAGEGKSFSLKICLCNTCCQGEGSQPEGESTKNFEDNTCNICMKYN